MGSIRHHYCHFDRVDDKPNYLKCVAKELFLSDVQETQFVESKEFDLLLWKP